MPADDEAIRDFWVGTLTAQASEEARLLAVSFASARGEPAIIILQNEGQAHAFLRALSAVRLALRDLVFPEVTDDQLASAEDIEDEDLPSEKRHALACYACFGLLQQSLIAQLCPEALS